MAIKLPGEDIEIILSLFANKPLGDVYDIAVKQETCGNTGLALKIYEYVADRFGVLPSDTVYERSMGAIIYTAIGKLYFLKDDYQKAESALDYASKLGATPIEAFYWKGELFYAKGDVDNANSLFMYVAENSTELWMISNSLKRLNEINRIN